MAENQKSFNDIIEKLALISGGLSEIIPNARPVVVFSLDDEKFYTIARELNFNQNNQFKIDMSGVEFIFLRDELLKNAEDNL